MTVVGHVAAISGCRRTSPHVSDDGQRPSGRNADPDGGRGGESTVGYGPLHPMRAEDDGVTYLALPTGFTYYAFGRIGSSMTNGGPRRPRVR